MSGIFFLSYRCFLVILVFLTSIHLSLILQFGPLLYNEVFDDVHQEKDERLKFCAELHYNSATVSYIFCYLLNMIS